MSAPREAVSTALFGLLVAAYPWRSSSRRLKLWVDVPLDQRPALYQTEFLPEVYSWTGQPTPKRTLGARLFIYIDAKDPVVVGATEFNNILDALDGALNPPTGQLKQTLGGLCDNCRIKGVSTKEPGDLDGDGVLIVEVELIFP